MKNPLIIAVTLALLASLTPSILPGMNFMQVQENPALQSAPVIPWLADGAALDERQSPLFVIEETPMRARCWVAVSSHGLHFRMEVEDAVHFNTFQDHNQWQGDGLQIGLDGWGDGSGKAPAETRGLNGPDDLAIGLALGAKGPQGWVYFSETKTLVGAMPASWLAVERHEPSQQTIYGLTLPWTALSVEPGALPAIGLAVQINDSGPDLKEQIRYYWGRGADGEPAPGLFNKLRLNVPPRPRVSVTALRLQPLSKAVGGEIAIGVFDSAKQTWEARLEGKTAGQEIPGSGGWQHWRLTIAPDDFQAEWGDHNLALSAVTSSRLDLTRSYPLTRPQDSYRRMLASLNAAETRSPHPLFTRHVRSVRAIAQTVWAQAQMACDEAPKEFDAVVEYCDSLAKGFGEECGDWASYLEGRRSLLFAYQSATDQTLQTYFFGLPQNWDPARAYPLFFELHGAGNPNQLAGVATRLGQSSKAPDLRGYSSPKTFAEIQRNGYWIHPHGRGNLGYRGIGETDLEEAYADAAKTFRFDPDRQYLYGFSMGGGGTWSYGLRTPDRWAALGIMAGGLWREDASVPLAHNCNHLPIMMWCGEKDFLFDQFKVMKDLLEKSRAVLTTETIPGLDHNYRIDLQEKTLNWLQQHVRTRPNHFYFVADTPEHIGAWGVRLKRDLAVSGVPAVSCFIETDKIILQTTGTNAVKVQLGPDGLNRMGETTVFWNGVQVYRGPPVYLLLKNNSAQPIPPEQAFSRWNRETW